MQPYIISRITKDFSWDNVPPLPICHHLWLPETPIQAQAKIAYDESGLYVLLKAWEQNIRAEEVGPLGAPYLDSCLEFFFKPSKEDIRYFNFEVNPNGCLLAGIGNPETGLVRIVNFTLGVTPEASRFEGGWQVSYHIPLSFIQLFFPEFKPISGGRIFGNCYKCGDLTEKRHFIAAFPIDLPEPQFHSPEFFGTLEFE